MSLASVSRGWRRKATAAVAAVALGAAALSQAPIATADNRGALRQGCTWDSYQYYTQHCQVFSAAMGRDIPVQIVPSVAGGDKALYLLDGLRSPEDASDWVAKGNAPRSFEGSNVNLVIPGGGTASFYTNWNQPSKSFNGPFNYQWETFLTEELPVYLEQQFGISRTGNSVAGLSMGASAALSLAYNHRDQFGQAIALSGYLHTTAPGMASAIQLAQLDAGGYNSYHMWGGPLSQERVRNDPYLNIERMKGLDLLIVTANGVPEGWNDPARLQQVVTDLGGGTLESLSYLSTKEFEAAARMRGLEATFKYVPEGVHNWANWDRQLLEARPRIEAFLGG